MVTAQQHSVGQAGRAAVVPGPDVVAVAPRWWASAAGERAAAVADLEGAAEVGWDQAPGWESWLKVHWFHTVFSHGTNGETRLRLLIHALLTVGALALVWPTFRRLGWGYGVFCAALIGIPTVATKDFMGMGRYLISAFPLFLTFALLLREHPRVRQGILAVGAVSLVLLSAAFGLDHYIS